MEAGSWNGRLGGMQPAPFPLYFRYLVGWANPVELPLRQGRRDDHQGRPALAAAQGTRQQGIKIDLPDQVIDHRQPAGHGQGLVV